MKTKFKLIAGLGNPSDKYEQTYHNAGSLFVKYLTEKEGEATRFKTSSSKLFQYSKSGEMIFLLTEVFMNESGKAIKDAIEYFNLKPEEVLICHDDSDITIGDYKITFEQSSAGHKGIDSIITTLNTNKFWRLRLGIRPAEEKVRQKAEAFVLKKISKVGLDQLKSAFEKAAQEISPLAES